MLWVKNKCSFQKETVLDNSFCVSFIKIKLVAVSEGVLGVGRGREETWRKSPTLRGRTGPPYHVYTSLCLCRKKKKHNVKIIVLVQTLCGPSQDSLSSTPTFRRCRNLCYSIYLSPSLLLEYILFIYFFTPKLNASNRFYLIIYFKN